MFASDQQAYDGWELTDAVVRDLDAAGGRPEGGINEEAEGHHPQGQDGGAGCHTDTEGGGEDSTGGLNRPG